MPSVNKIELMGNLGQDPEIRHFPDGTPAAKISLAVSETWTDKNTGQKQERTEWFTVLFRNKLAETVGRQSRQFTDKTGATRTVWEVHAHEMQIIHTKNRIVTNEITGDVADNEIYPADSGDLM